MARVIKVTPEQLERTATAISGLADEYKNLYDQFYSETNAMADKWKGDDNLAFINQIDGFKDDFKLMHTEMMKYVDFLQKSAKAYRDTQENVVSQAKNLIN